MTIIEPELKTKSAAMQATAKNMRTFGVGGSVIFTAIWALRLFVFHHGNAWPLLVVAAFFLITGLFIHPVMKPVYIGWTWVAHKIGWFNTRLILGIIFYLVFAPMGLVMRLFGRDSMQRKLEPNRESYWLPVTWNQDLSQYEKEF